MRAFVLPDFERLPTLADIPTPEAGPGEVLVRVRASSLNGFDLSVAADRLRGMMEYRFPVVLGKDFAGTVAAVGADATRFAVGDPVFGVVMKPELGDGAFSEYLAVAEGYGITRMPEGLDVHQAGALGLAGAAAWDSVEAVAPAAGEAILISGASGGVGAIAVQLAAARGATVIGTAKPGEESAFVRDLGAGHVVDYTDDLAKQVRAIRPGGVEAVIHLAGDAPQLADLLVPGGRFASTLGVGSDQLGGRDVRATAVMANPEAATLDRLAADVVAGTRGKLAAPSPSRMRTREDSMPVLAIVGAGPGMGLAIAKTPDAIALLYWELHTQRDKIEKVFTPSGGEQLIS